MEIIRSTDEGRKRVSDIDDGPQWYADVCRRMRASSKPIAEIIVLSPSRAEELLRHNTGNRWIGEESIRTLAKDIESDLWQFNGETIVIANTGELNNGQHRCHAVIRSGKAIETVMVAGVARDSRMTIDQGRQRTLGDFLHMHDLPNAKLIGAVATIVRGFETESLAGQGKKMKSANVRNFTISTRRPTKQEILTFARANIFDINRAIASVDANHCAVIGGYGRIAGMLCVLARHAGWHAALPFMHGIVSGENLRRGHPAFAVRERLLSEKQALTLTAAKTFEIIARGWNAYRRGDDMAKIQLHGQMPPLMR